MGYLQITGQLAQYLLRMRVSQVEKENGLFREYIKTLEMQVRANAEQRNALCKQMNNINHENLQLNRRISAQPMQLASQAALQHYEERFRSECLKNVTISKELTAAKTKLQELQSNSTVLQGRIDELQSENLRMKDEAGTVRELEGEVQLLKQMFEESQSRAVSLDLLSRELQKEREQNKILKDEKEQLACRVVHLQREIEKLSLQIRQLQERQREDKGEIDMLGQQADSYKSAIIVLEKQKKDQQRLFEQNIASMAKQSDQIAKQSDQIGKQLDENRALTQQNLLIVQQKAKLLDSLTVLSSQKLQLQQQNEELALSLEKAKAEVEELSGEIKQFVNERVHQKSRKNRTENCAGKTHFEFNNAFQGLKVQIQAIKNDHQTSPIDKSDDCGPKENMPLEISSPSKWKSVEGKLSLLRSTQSMSRFR